MDWAVLFDLVVERLQQPSLYAIVVGVGLLINLYGQIIVPWLRGMSPLRRITEECDERPWLFMLSVFVAFLFPLIVGTVSSVATSYVSRHVKDRASFPDEKPDPVFRMDLQGNFVEMGRSTRQLLERHPAHDARALLGDAAYKSIVDAHASRQRLPRDTTIRFADHCYLVTQSPSSDGKLINVYLARIADVRASLCNAELSAASP